MNALIELSRMQAADYRCQERAMMDTILDKEGLTGFVGRLKSEKRKVDLLECDCQSRGAIDAVAVTTALFDNRKE